MIDGQKPYSAMNDSGVEWLGEVPAHWRILPGRVCFRAGEQLNVGLQETTVLSLSYGRIVVKPQERLHGLVPSSFETYQIVNPIDIVIRPTDLQNDRNSLRFGLSRHRGIITSAYLCFSVTDEVIPEYGFSLLHSYDLMKVFYGLGSGLRQNLDWTDFKYLPCCIPPLTEQTAIVRFLEHADRRISHYIRAKQKLIELLEEQKQAIIHRAVTGQIDVRTKRPFLAYKPSSVEWLGEVPEHWEVHRLGNLASKFGSGITPRGGAAVYKESGVPFLRSQNIHFSGLRMQDVARIAPSLHRELHVSRVKRGDVLLNITGASIGRVCSVPNDFVEGNVNQHVCVIRPNPSRLLPSLLAAYLSTPFMQREIQFEQSGASREGLTLQSIRNFKIVVPRLHEQAIIVRYLDRMAANIDSAVIRTNHQIDLLREYRTRLIADVVTGKLDVREAAARLPDVDPLAEEHIGDLVHAEVGSNLEEDEAAQEVNL